MPISNCFIHAVTRWVTRGGWLIMRRSHAGPYPHFIHADHLPEDLPVSHFVPYQKSRFWRPLFSGRVERQIGIVKPPDANGFDWSLFAFWSIYFSALIAVPWMLVWVLT